jgi:DNA-binding NarL/FixJ family response regulator
MTDHVRIVLADDSYLVREGTRMLLEDTGRISVVGTAADAEELVAKVAELTPDVVITDIRMPPHHDTEGIEAAHRIREAHPDIGVVVLSQYADGGYALQLFNDGTERLGYLLKERVGDLDELLNAVETVAGGGSIIDPQIVEVLVASRARQARSPLRTLTSRESEVLREMARGRNNAGVAVALHISESAVEKHVSQIFSKLAISEQPQTSRRVAAVLTFLSSEPN